MSSKILAIDPGGTIGFAKLTVKDRVILEDIEVSQQKSDSENRAFGSIPMLTVEWADVVVIEDFIGAGPRTKESKYTTKQIGAFEQEALRLGKKFVIQAPAMRRKHVKLGVTLFQERTGNKVCHHGKDALAHGLRYISETYDVKLWLEKYKCS